MLPMDRIEPTLPIDRIDPSERIDRMDRREFHERMDWLLSAIPRSTTSDRTANTNETTLFPLAPGTERVGQLPGGR